TALATALAAGRPVASVPSSRTVASRVATRRAGIAPTRVLVTLQQRAATLYDRAPRAGDDLIGKLARELDGRIRLADVDSSHVAAGDARLARDHADQVGGPKTLARSNAREERDHRPGVLGRRGMSARGLRALDSRGSLLFGRLRPLSGAILLE